MELATNIAGWIGSALVVLAYFLVSHKYVTGSSRTYQWLNIFGVIGVGANVFHQHAWPSFVLQAVWGLIAISSLIQHRNEKNNHNL